MVEIKRGEFTPISVSGKNAYSSREDILIYAYAPTDFREQGLREDVIVARPPGFPGQYLIGPSSAVLCVAQAFNIVDSVQPSSHHRQLNVVLTRDFDTETWDYRDFTDGKSCSFELINRFGGIAQQMREFDYLFHPSILGVCNELINPVFFSPNYLTLAQEWGTEFIPVYWASMLWHEWIHVLQHRHDLPSLSLWSERHAITDNSAFIFQLVNSGRLTKRVEDVAVKILRHFSKLLYDYRNARGWENHLESDELQDTPTKEQELYSGDFVFGY